MSDSLWPHGLQPTRLLHPWDFPGKSATTWQRENRGDPSEFDAHPKCSRSLRTGVRAEGEGDGDIGGPAALQLRVQPLSPEGPWEPCQEALAPERMIGRGRGVGPWQRESLREADPEWRGPDAQQQPHHGDSNRGSQPSNPQAPASARPLGYQCPILSVPKDCDHLSPILPPWGNSRRSETSQALGEGSTI